MMDEFRIHGYRYLPLIEILWDNRLRSCYNFLKKNDEVGKIIKSSLSNLTNEKFNVSSNNANFKGGNKINKIKDDKYSFVMNYGFFHWALNKDGFIYYRVMEDHIQNNEAFRPLIPLVTPAVKWKEIRANDDTEIKVFNARKKIYFHPQLAIESERAFSIRSDDDNNDVGKIINKIKQYFYRENKKDMERLTKAIFSGDFIQINRFSDIVWVIESTVENFKKTGALLSLTESKRVAGFWIYHVQHNIWLIIYGNKNPHKKQRLRVIKALRVANMLFSLWNKAKQLLESRMDLRLGITDRLEFIEYLFATLNPANYSSDVAPTFYFDKHYQRLIFHYVIEKTKGEKHFDLIRDKISKLFITWDPYEQLMILTKNSIAAHQFRKNVKINKESYTKPVLSNRELTMLKFLIYKFLKDLPSDVTLSDGFNNSNIGKCSKNYLWNNIQKWMKDKGIKEVKITQNELRIATTPLLLKTLKDKDLIKILIGEKRAKEYYQINIQNPYVKDLVMSSR